jgi:predicted nicotinamide N-methyase
MNGAKMIRHSTNNSGKNLRGGARAASSAVWRQDVVAQEMNHHTTRPAPKSTFFHSSPSKSASASLRESSSRDFRDELEQATNSSSRNSATTIPQVVHGHHIPLKSSSVPTELSSTSTSPPPLLLEGDNYHLSSDGVARTLYRMRRPSSGASGGDTSLTASSGVLQVEELYDLRYAKKKFILRRDPLPPLASSEDDHVIVAGEAIQEVDLQEIAGGVLGGAGTGATTWESSIVMAMVLASRPELLQGDVVELGSGVGLGGILCALGPGILPVERSRRIPATKSFTLTDINPMVLEQCRKNVETFDTATVTPLHVSKLDWYDFLHPHSSFEKPSLPANQVFDTVIACDCAYRPQDIAALAATMTSLLRDEHSQIHIFGPSNRNRLEELLTLLREEYQLSVTVQPLEMERYRLRPPKDGSHLSDFLVNSIDEGQECLFATSTISRFLHIICSPNNATLKIDENLSDID